MKSFVRRKAEELGLEKCKECEKLKKKLEDLKRDIIRIDKIPIVHKKIIELFELGEKFKEKNHETK